MRLKRKTNRIWLVFYKMSDFRGNEIFSNGPFIMLGIDGGWREKLAHIEPPYCDMVPHRAGVPPAVAGASRSGNWPGARPSGRNHNNESRRLPQVDILGVETLYSSGPGERLRKNLAKRKTRFYGVALQTCSLRLALSFGLSNGPRT